MGRAPPGPTTARSCRTNCQEEESLSLSLFSVCLSLTRKRAAIFTRGGLQNRLHKSSEGYASDA